VRVTGGDVYGELLRAGLQFAATTSGPVKLEGTLSPLDGSRPPLRRTETIQVVDVNGPPLTGAFASCR